MTERDRYLTGILLDERLELSLGDLCRLCRVTGDEIRDMVTEGILDPRGDNPQSWCFSGQALIRVERTLHLQRDLQVNLAGAALVLDLLEELEALRCRLG
jgi:chaperone modulatory protein CbpM